MGKIPLFQQERLASSVVGTPGVDLSGSQAFSAQASALQQIGNSAFQVAGAELSLRNQELRQKRAEQRAAEQAMQEGLAKLTVANTMLGFEDELEQIITATRDEHLQFPEAAGALIKENGRALLDRYAQGIPDPITRMNFKAQGLNSLRSALGQNETWERQAHLTKQVAEAENAFDKFSLRLGNRTNTPQVLADIENFNTTQMGIYRQQLGPKADKLGQIALEEGIDNFFAHLARDNPAELDRVVNEKVFEDYMPQDKITSAYRAAKRYEVEVQRQKQSAAEIDATTAGLQEIGELDVGLTKNTHSIRDIDLLKKKYAAKAKDPDNPARKVYAELFKQASALEVHHLSSEAKAQEKSQTKAQKIALDQEKRELGIAYSHMRAGIMTRSQKLRSDATLEQLLKFKTLNFKATKLPGSVGAARLGRDRAWAELAIKHFTTSKEKKFFGFAVSVGQEELLKYQKNRAASEEQLKIEAEIQETYYQNIPKLRANPKLRGREPSATQLQSLWAASVLTVEELHNGRN